jgi:FlaA1/EpsC-like NDP-sugar epimerase
MSRLGLYRIHFRNAGAWSFWNALSAAGAGVATALIVDTLAHPLLLGTAGAVLFLYLALTGFLLPRVAYTLVAAAYVRRPRSGRPALIQGVGRIETALAERALADPDLDLRPVGFLHDKPELGGRRIHGLPVVASTDLGVAGILRLHGARVVVTVAGETSPSRLAELREACDAAGADLLLYSESLTPVVTPGSGARDHDPASVARARSRARSA